MKRLTWPAFDTPTPNESGIALNQDLGQEWNDVLQYVPEDKRGEVVPKLKEWDSKFNDVQTNYNKWSDFDKAQLDPEQVNLAVSVLSQIETNPRMVYDALGTHLGITPDEAKELVDEAQQQKSQEDGGSSGNNFNDPRFERLEKQVNTLSEYTLASHEEKLVQREQTQLEDELSDLREKHGEFDEREVILRMMHEDMSAEDAFEDYSKFLENIYANRAPRPKMLGGGGSVPNPSIDPTTLDDRGRRDLVTQMLASANLENG